MNAPRHGPSVCFGCSLAGVGGSTPLGMSRCHWGGLCIKHGCRLQQSCALQRRVARGSKRAIPPTSMHACKLIAGASHLLTTGPRPGGWT